MADDVVLVDVDAGVALVTLNRPESRNALSRQLLRELRRVMGELDGRDDVDAIVLTGADPAFCAGLDLKELGQDGGVLNDEPPPEPSPAPTEREPTTRRGVLSATKPIIGAVNGVAVTGGLELALNCDFLVASERARFADTHARVGVQPLWGLTVLLPEAVGVRRAREMSTTGNFVDAPTALAWGLVNHVVAHEELVPFALQLARDITTSDQVAMRHLRGTYERTLLAPGAEAWRIEQERAAAFHRGPVDPAEIERRRQGVVGRGRTQV
ncbi:MAG: enoyl-CoA hydratase [Acidimicrobiales bacterium]